MANFGGPKRPGGEDVKLHEVCNIHPKAATPSWQAGETELHRGIDT